MPGFGGATNTAKTQVEYRFIAGGFNGDFVRLFTDLGNDGWEFCGSFEPTEMQLLAALKDHKDRVIAGAGSRVTLIFKRQKNSGLRGSAPGGGGGPMGPGLPPGVSGGPGGGGGPPGATGGGGGKSGSSGGPSGIGSSGGAAPPGPSSHPPGVSAGIAPLQDNRTLTVIALKNGSAADLADVLDRVFRSQGVMITPETRSNTLIIRADAKTLEELKALVEKLDVPGKEPIG